MNKTTTVTTSSANDIADKIFLGAMVYKALPKIIAELRKVKPNAAKVEAQVSMLTETAAEAFDFPIDEVLVSACVAAVVEVFKARRK
jgi:hypothetical protein